MFKRKKNDAPVDEELEYGTYEDEGVYSDYDYDEYDENDEEYEEQYDDEYYDEYDDEYEEEPRSVVRTVVYMLVVLLLALGVAIALWFAADDVLALTKPDNSITITIKEGDTLEDVAQNLADHGLVKYKSLFILYGKFSNAQDRISAGTFELNQMFDYHALVNGLAGNSDVRETVTLTFPEGYSVDQIFSLLADNGVCTLEELEETAANHEFDLVYLQNIPYGEANRLEGYLFPDTYEFYVDDEPVRVINKLLNNFDSKVTEEMLAAIDDLNRDLRKTMEEEGSFSEEEIENAQMDISKIITVASLIEKEAGADSERGRISSVIYNRLTTRVHELLQIDATVEYALGEHKTELTANDLGVDDPYNTYRNKGLPPGPIANPGLTSIMAAIYPDDTEYFFYALNSSGTHDFFYTYMEQQDFLNGIVRDDDDEEETDAEEASAMEEGEPFSQQTVVDEEGREEIVNAQ